MKGLVMSRLLSIILVAMACCPSFALDRPGTIFKIFQFPPNMIPRIDGDPEDWKIVPDGHRYWQARVQNIFDYSPISLHSILFILLALACCPSFALDRPGSIFKIFQFPPNMIPRIDGDPEDWKILKMED